MTHPLNYELEKLAQDREAINKSLKAQHRLMITFLIATIIYVAVMMGFIVSAVKMLHRKQVITVKVIN